MRDFRILAGAAVLAVAVLPGFARAEDQAPERVRVELYLMSQCPFGLQAVAGMREALVGLEDRVELGIFFIGNEVDGELTSMHGPDEVTGDLLQICAVRYAPRRYLELIACMGRELHSIPGNFDECAADSGVPAAVVRACAEGEQGRKLLAESFEASARRGAQGSPTLYIGNDLYQGGRDGQAFQRAICAKFPSGKPETCEKLPPIPVVNVTVLVDRRCTECNTERYVGSLKGMFPGLQVRTIDWAEPEGVKLYGVLSAHGLPRVPAYIFDDGIQSVEGSERIDRFLKEAGPYQVLEVGATWNPTDEICDNKVDDDGNGRLDCADEDCREKLICRKKIPGKLDIFVMSLCPFAVKAINSMEPVLDAFGNGIKFDIHYIAKEEKGKFHALHGEPEVAENQRQLCAAKYYGKDNRYLDYIWCRNEDIRNPEWKRCATGGIRAEVIERCANGVEGRKLLSRDARLAEQLGIQASPTWLLNNQKKFSGLDAKTIQENLCRENPGLKGCEKGFPDTQSPVGPGGCGGD
jgi:hypothetical protein